MLPQALLLEETDAMMKQLITPEIIRVLFLWYRQTGCSMPILMKIPMPCVKCITGFNRPYAAVGNILNEAIHPRAALIWICRDGWCHVLSGKNFSTRGWSFCKRPFPSNHDCGERGQSCWLYSRKRILQQSGSTSKLWSDQQRHFNRQPDCGLDIASRFRWLTAKRSTVVQTSAVHSGTMQQPGENCSIYWNNWYFNNATSMNIHQLAFTEDDALPWQTGEKVQRKIMTHDIHIMLVKVKFGNRLIGSIPPASPCAGKFCGVG